MSHRDLHGNDQLNELVGANPTDETMIPTPPQFTLSLRESDEPPPGARGPSAVFPEELIFEILARVPVNCLLRFRCVCKSWNSLISDPQFVKSHLHKSISNPNFNHHRLVLYTRFKFDMDGWISCSVQSLLNNSLTPPEDLSDQLKCEYWIVGSCNGLLCLGNGKKFEYVYLWNPSTRLKSELSPCLGYNWNEHCQMLFGFGYDHLTENYKVVSVFCDLIARGDSPKTVVKVYTLGSNFWRQIQSFPHLPLVDNGKFVSGTLNWLVFSESSDDGLVASIDLGKETYAEVMLPDHDERHISAPALGVLRESLCFSYKHGRTHFVMWLMKEYGVKESWTKLVTIPYSNLGVLGRFRSPKPLFMSVNGVLILRINGVELVVYDPADNELKYPQIHWCECDPMIYVESLVSPYS